MFGESKLLTFAKTVQKWVDVIQKNGLHEKNGNPSLSEPQKMR